MRPVCIICGKNEQTFGWVIHRWFLRRTEISMLWENCCCEKCYEKLLVGLLNKTYKIKVVNNVATLETV